MKLRNDGVKVGSSERSKKKMLKNEQKMIEQRNVRFSQTTGAKATTSTVTSRATQRKWIRRIMKEPTFTTWWLETSTLIQQQRLRSRIPDMPKKESRPGTSLTPFLTLDFLCSKCSCSPNRPPDIAHEGKSWFLHLLSELGSEKIVASGFTALDLCWSRYMKNSKSMFLNGKIEPNYQALYMKRSTGVDLVQVLGGAQVLKDEDVGIQDWVVAYPNPQQIAAMTKETSTLGRGLKDPIAHQMGWEHAWRGADRARTAWFFLAMAIIEQYLDDTQRKESSSQLAIRSHGCVVCSKELPLVFDSYKVSSGSGPMPCTMCYNVAWCSKECKNKEKNPHSFHCLGKTGTGFTALELSTLHQNM